MPILSFTHQLFIASEMNAMDAAVHSPLNIGHEETTMTDGQNENPVQQVTHLNDELSDTQDLGRRPASLLTIPRELRDEVYQLLLKPDRSISLNLFPYDEAARAFLALAATCKQTRAEATDLFFKNNFVWSICSVPHYSCEHHYHRMKRLQLMLDSKLVCSIALSAKELSIDWDQHVWTMPVAGSNLLIYPSQSPPGLYVDVRRRHAVLQAVHSLIHKQSGMNADALNVLGNELRHSFRRQMMTARNVT